MDAQKFTDYVEYLAAQHMDLKLAASNAPSITMDLLEIVEEALDEHVKAAIRLSLVLERHPAELGPMMLKTLVKGD